jgi:hypothetical protein
MAGFEGAPNPPLSSAEKILAERRKIEVEITALRAHADDLEKNIEQITEARADRAS